MATYVYRNSAGEIREVFASMKNPPPEKVWFDGEGNWHPLEETVTHQGHEIPLGPLDPAHAAVFTRVYGAGLQVRGETPANKYPYPSLRHAGRFSEEDAPHMDVTIRGVPHKNIPIVQSPAHEAYLAAKYGLKRE